MRTDYSVEYVWFDEATDLQFDETTGKYFVPHMIPAVLPSMVNWRDDRLSRRPFSGPRKTLKVVNDELALEDRHLHPTKGFRKTRLKRSMASVIVDMVKRGEAVFELQSVKETLKQVNP